MNAALLRNSDGLSPLAADLAVSRLSVAVLRAVGNEPPTDQDRSCAAKLRESLIQELNELRGTALIPAEVVPQESMRRELEETLSTLAHVGASRKRCDPELLEGLVGLLQGFEQQALSGAQMRDLLAGLLRLGKEEEPRAAIPDLNLLIPASHVR
jgi:hypothetical protein